MSLIQFSLTDLEEHNLFLLADSKGFPTGSLYAKRLVQDALGSVAKASPFALANVPLLSARESWILSQLAVEPLTLTQICKNTGKFQTSLGPIMQRVQARGWALAQKNLKFTGGRPAVIFEITEAGRFMLEKEQERRDKLAVEASERLKAARQESAMSHPDPLKPKPKETLKVGAEHEGTPEGAWLQAAIDTTAGLNLPDREAQIQAEFERTRGMVEFGVSTWEAFTEGLRADGWGVPS